MRGDKNATTVLGGELFAGVEGHAQLRLVRWEFDLREHGIGWWLHVFQVRRGSGTCHLEFAIPVRIAKVLTLFGGAVQLTRWDVVAQTIGLVVGPPQGAVFGVEVLAHRVTATNAEDLAVTATEGVHAHDAANAQAVELVDLVSRLHVERLTQRDVQLAIRTDAAGARTVVVGLVLGRDQFALWHHLNDRHVRAFVEEFSGWEVQHAVVFSHDQEAVLGPAHTVGHLEIERGRK